MIDLTTETLEAKEARLRAIFRELGSCVVAFSGGVDSALVLHVAAQELGERAVGITARSESLAEREYGGAVAFAAGIEARHEVIETRELHDPNYAANPVDRCYFCKSELYGKLAEIARDTLRRDFRHFRSEESRILLLDGSPHVLPAYPVDLSEQAARQLIRLGVKNLRSNPLKSYFDCERRNHIDKRQCQDREAQGTRMRKPCAPFEQNGELCCDNGGRQRQEHHSQ